MGNLTEQGLEKEFAMALPAAYGDVCKLLYEAAKLTESDVNLTLQRTLAYHEADKERGLYSHLNDAHGQIRRGNFQLGILANGADVDEPQDPTENYFSCIKFFQEFGFRGGDPTAEDKIGLQAYLDDVASAMRIKSRTLQIDISE